MPRRRNDRVNATEWTCPDCEKVCRGTAVIATHPSKCFRKRQRTLPKTQGLHSTPTLNVSQEHDDFPYEGHHSHDPNFLYENTEEETDSDDEVEEESFPPPQSSDIPELYEDELIIEPGNTAQTNIDDILRSFEITPDQRKAARYILTSGKSSRGLSIKMTELYLQSLPDGCGALQMWPSGQAFWDDHNKRQMTILPMIGGWKKIPMPSVEHSASYSVPDYCALIRDLPSTIKHVIESAQYLKLDVKNGQTWSQCIRWDPMIELDASGERIVHDFYTSDDLIYTHKMLQKNPEHRDASFLPIQLFIDKANVTRLNKRSMYPVVLYLLCFPRQIRRYLAVNVGFIPVVTTVSKSGGCLSSALTKLVRRSVVQVSLAKLFRPLTETKKLSALFPGQGSREFSVVLLSIVADLPEAAILQSMRYGLKAYYPCCRCYTKKEDLDLIPQIPAQPRTARNAGAIYEEAEKLGTKREQEEKLKESSLSLPRSALLSRFELNIDTPALSDTFRAEGCLPENYQPFGLSSLIKFESLHNFDLGITADILRAIERYFSVLLTPAIATKIVNAANAYQGILPRRSDSSMFRLPSAGLTIAPSHANVNAMQYKSALCILPFILRGATKSASNNDVDKSMFRLLECVFAYAKLHHYARRVNEAPYFVYDRVESETLVLLRTFNEKYVTSLGLTKPQSESTAASRDGATVQTLKSHQLFAHLIKDVKSGGLLSNFDAQAGESHHVHTKAHYELTSRRAEAESQVARRSSVRELGIFEKMYPLRRETRVISSNSIEREEGQGSETISQSDTDTESGEVQRHRRRLGIQNVRGSSTNVGPEALDGLSKLEFERLLDDFISTKGAFTVRQEVKSIKTRQTLTIKAIYPWIPETADRNFVLNSLKGIKQHIRASDSFYTGEPQYDFIEYRVGAEQLMGQVRCIFVNPHLRAMHQNPLLALVRKLVGDGCGPDGEDIPCRSTAVQPIDWSRKTISLFRQYGCTHLRWCSAEAEEKTHVIVAVSDILRPVSVIPDFHSPVGMEVGSKAWREATARDVEKDRKRYNRDLEKRRRTGRGEVLPLRSFLDGPVLQVARKHERFFYNPYMLWTSASI